MKKLAIITKWNNLGISQQEEIKKIIKYTFPYLEFEFDNINNRIYNKGASGSSADFVEIGVESLFQLVIDIIYKNNKDENNCMGTRNLTAIVLNSPSN